MKGWIKCPSVTPGGKPFFYRHKERKLWVVWDREHLAWKISKRNDGPAQFVGPINYYNTAPAAMKAAEQLNAVTNRKTK